MRRDVFLMRALSISPLLGFVKVLPMAQAGRRAFCSSRITLGYERCMAMRQIPPPRTIRKWESWRWFTLSSVSATPRPTPPTASPKWADWPAGNAETSWHRGGNRRQARRWMTTSRLFPVIETLHGRRGGAVAASNRRKKVEGGRKHGASDENGGPARTLLKRRPVVSEQRNRLHSACRLVSLVDDAARRDPRRSERLVELNTN